MKSLGKLYLLNAAWAPLHNRATKTRAGWIRLPIPVPRPISELESEWLLGLAMSDRAELLHAALRCRSRAHSISRRQVGPYPKLFSYTIRVRHSDTGYPSWLGFHCCDLEELVEDRLLKSTWDCLIKHEAHAKSDSWSRPRFSEDYARPNLMCLQMWGFLN